jgi:hypothetical protein
MGLRTSHLPEIRHKCFETKSQDVNSKGDGWETLAPKAGNDTAIPDIDTHLVE